MSSLLSKEDASVQNVIFFQRIRDEFIGFDTGFSHNRN